jgi:hypothetical protein
MATVFEQPANATFAEYADRGAQGEELQSPRAPEPARARRWMIGVLGGSDQKGRWRLGSRLWIVAVLGGVKLDLGQAEPEAPESLITVIAVFGGAELTAPPGVPVELTGASLLGGKSDERPSGPALPGCPVIRVRVFSLFGGVSVKAKKTNA